MRKYHCLWALFISLLLCACNNTADTAEKTNTEQQNAVKPSQQEQLL